MDSDNEETPAEVSGLRRTPRRGKTRGTSRPTGRALWPRPARLARPAGRWDPVSAPRTLLGLLSADTSPGSTSVTDLDGPRGSLLRA